MGTHAYYHGLDTLIHAARLLQDHKDLAFLMIGNGPERSRIIQLAEELKVSNVVFGQSPYEEMARLYSISYASIATLRNLDVANQMRLSKVFPSLSCGVPVIYAGLGEAADVIRDNHCGMTVPPESPEKLAEAIEQLASNRPGRDLMGKMGRQLVEADYSWKIIVTRWLQELGIKSL